MVTVKKSGYNITITGHARSGNKNVCSMLSCLCITLHKSLQDLTDSNFYISEGFGEFILTFNEEPETDAQLLIGSFLIGIRELVKDFADYIELAEH